MRKIITLAVVSAALLVSACNTIAGLGRDTAAVGGAVADAADDARR